MVENAKQILELRIPRDNEYTLETAGAFFSSFSKIMSSSSFTSRFFGRKEEALVLEIVVSNQKISFYAVLDQKLIPYFESQILATYPLVSISQKDDWPEDWSKKEFYCGQMVQTSSYYYPIKADEDFKDTDPLNSLLAIMSKAHPEDKMVIQYTLLPAPKNWQSKAQKAITAGIKISEEERLALPGEQLIKTKMGFSGLRAGIRIAASNESLLRSLIGGFAVYAKGDGNSLKFKKPGVFNKEKFTSCFLTRGTKFVPTNQIFSSSELAALWHLPGINTKLPNLAWGQSVLTEPPENLPTTESLTDEEKTNTNFFAKTEYKNKMTIFGIKKNDRRRHVYTVGKTGSGKSTLLSNMAIDDIKKGNGLAIIDPHGDTCEELLEFIPARRVNDVCYFNPADVAHPVALNVLEVINPAQKELIASGIVSIFKKLYGLSWGPRLEWILRYTLLTLCETPGSTLVDVPRILTDKKFREYTLSKINDPVLLNFWKNEFGSMNDRMREDAINPILNKVGQFVSSPSIRNIIGAKESTINFEEIMNEGKILVVNLSQGRLGEDNSALLGAMIITKLQLAAMNRVTIKEEKRRDFYLYVDEFQNFATDSFIKILSEARKYRLALFLANQYMAQLEIPIQKAILGNAGTIVAFIVGSEDASILENEFGGHFTSKDLVGLDNFQIITKLTIDNLTSRPFFAYTLPPAENRNQASEKIIRVSRERYGQKELPKPVEIQTTAPAKEQQKPKVPIIKYASKLQKQVIEIKKALPSSQNNNLMDKA
ncbi:type IV secretion system DNA-binding domain-containing protein, partial [Patescibacteria group bacterium]|nr:type IV secretion system DNA-binding domain-containing protein [Patescibacteria group bacterium]